MSGVQVTRRMFLALLSPTVAAPAVMAPRAAVAQPQRHYHGERDGAHVWVVFRRRRDGGKYET